MAEERPVGQDGEMIDFSSILPDNYIALSFTAQVKALDETGQVVLMHVRSPDLTVWESMGMAMSAAQYYDRIMAGTDG